MDFTARKGRRCLKAKSLTAAKKSCKSEKVDEKLS
jgi:hypothetical protein